MTAQSISTAYRDSGDTTNGMNPVLNTGSTRSDLSVDAATQAKGGDAAHRAISAERSTLAVAAAQPGAGIDAVASTDTTSAIRAVRAAHAREDSARDEVREAGTDVGVEDEVSYVVAEGTTNPDLAGASGLFGGLAGAVGGIGFLPAALAAVGLAGLAASGDGDDTATPPPVIWAVAVAVAVSCLRFRPLRRPV